MSSKALATDEALNQTPPIGDVNLYSGDPALAGVVKAFARPTKQDEAELVAFGQRWGTAELAEHGRLANENPPKLDSGTNTIEFHPSYHRLMQESVIAGIHSSTWGADGKTIPGAAHVLRAARLHMADEVEAGHLCPIVMTHAATAALAAEPALVSEWLPRIVARDYDPVFRPAREKKGATLGMGMTEKQGGSDVRANTTRAERAGDHYRITGHKWFFSAPMCDAFLVLAQAKGGLSCFLMPRFKPDGSVNALNIVKLKDKLGNRSNASSEVEFEGAFAWRCGPEGEGVKTIIAMVQLTRLDCVIASAGHMRAALAAAIHHVRHRRVFQKKLVDQPLMRAVIADLALEREAALALAFRLAAAFGRAGTDADEAAFARLITPVAKLWICKSTPGFVYEALECLGGNGYVEDYSLARLYREAPLNAIWEGAGNVMALDLLRGAEREKEAVERVLTALARSVADLPNGPWALDRMRSQLRDPEREGLARRTGETLALIAASAALAASAPPAIAEAFAAQRLGGGETRLYGNPMPAPIVTQLIERSLATVL
jgi:putative acyl-CoA dehydrogenase